MSYSYRDTFNQATGKAIRGVVYGGAAWLMIANDYYILGTVLAALSVGRFIHSYRLRQRGKIERAFDEFEQSTEEMHRAIDSMNEWFKRANQGHDYKYNDKIGATTIHTFPPEKPIRKGRRLYVSKPDIVDVKWEEVSP